MTISQNGWGVTVKRPEEEEYIARVARTTSGPWPYAIFETRQAARSFRNIMQFKAPDGVKYSVYRVKVDVQ
jgi:hypothetical protein